MNNYNETGEILVPDLSIRKKGTGSISFNKKQRKWEVRSAQLRKHIGLYNTKEKALEALNIYNKTGKRMASDVFMRKKVLDQLH